MHTNTSKHRHINTCTQGAHDGYWKHWCVYISGFVCMYEYVCTYVYLCVCPMRMAKSRMIFKPQLNFFCENYFGDPNIWPSCWLLAAGCWLLDKLSTHLWLGCMPMPESNAYKQRSGAVHCNNVHKKSSNDTKDNATTSRLAGCLPSSCRLSSLRFRWGR